MIPKITYKLGNGELQFAIGTPADGDKIILRHFPSGGYSDAIEFTKTSFEPGLFQFSNANDLSDHINYLLAGYLTSVVVEGNIILRSLMDFDLLNAVVLNGTGIYSALNLKFTNTREYIFDGFATFHQEWEADENEYKNPFTREKKYKRWGYFYKAVISYDGIEYLELNFDFRNIFNVNATERKFYPNKDAAECYDVDINNGYAIDDMHKALAYSDVEIVFRGLKCFKTPMNHPVGYWGDRTHKFSEFFGMTFHALSGGE